MLRRLACPLLVVLLALIPIMLVACSGGGSGSTPAESFLDIRAHAQGVDGRDVYSDTHSVRVVPSAAAAGAPPQVTSAELPLSPEPNLTSEGLRRVIIGFKNPPSSRTVSALAAGGARIRYRYNLIPAVAAAVTEDQLKALQQDPSVAYVGDDVLKHTCAQELPWGVNTVNAERVWGEAEGASHVTRPEAAGQGVEVAIIDTGAQLDHPDLAANIVGGWDIPEEDDTPQDTFGHGTHVAGIVAAVDNQVGIIGGGPKVSLYIVRVSTTGSFSVAEEIAGIEKAVQHGSNIISMSISGPQGAGELEACQAAWDAGALLVGAAGNNGGTVEFPAAFDSVIAVGAVDQNLEAPSWSNRGPQLELAAPGVNILSTALDSQYDTRDGTSFGVPLVSAAAAIVMGLHGTNNLETRQVLTETALDLGTPGRDNIYGFGLLDVARAAGVIAADEYEPDDASAQASVIAIDGPRRNHTLYPEGDQDWLRFDGNFGDLFTVETWTHAAVAAHNVVPTPDTYIEVRNPDGQVIASSDNKSAEDTDSRVDFSAAADGTYRVLIRASAQAAPDKRIGSYQVAVSRSANVPLTVELPSVIPADQVPANGSVLVRWTVSAASPELVHHSNIEYWRRGSSQHHFTSPQTGLGSFTATIPATP